ncbi:MAG: YidC/Oxa1 family membrane protein insertase [Candidatus Moranbacteria bacterium]|nr:YidC/Oxa1 family membrane protein insertase [Candidatus Moranbacteria bacterium]
MAFLFNELIYQPIYNLLILIYNIIPGHDFGVAIIIVTILVKFVLIPFSRKQIESQKKMQELQPKIKEVQQKYKNDKEKQSRAMMELYKENKANPFSGCLPMILQLVFLIAIYRVLFNISKDGAAAEGIYPFIYNPGVVKHVFLGFLDLSVPANIHDFSISNAVRLLLVVAAAAAQFFQTKMLMAKSTKAKEAKEAKNDKKDPDFSQAMSQQMLYLAPVMTLLIGLRFPSGLALYWLVSTLFMIVQQGYLQREELKAKDSR